MMTQEEMIEVDRLASESGVEPYSSQGGLIITLFYKDKEDAIKVLKYIYHHNRKLFNKLDGYCNGHNRIKDKLMNYYHDSSWYSETPQEPDYYYISWR